MSGGETRHWVLIETGGNQAYIFDTNRLRHVVDASYLVDQAGTEWVPHAARAHGADEVLAISGKALLLVSDPAVGHAVISEVSARALRDAPGLEITGVVGPGFDPAKEWPLASASDGLPTAGPAPARTVTADPTETATATKEPAGPAPPPTHVEALAQTYELLELARASRPSPLLRDPLLPWFEVCRESGFPAAGVEWQPEDEEERRDLRPVAASVLAKSQARRAAGQRLADLLKDLAEIVPPNLDELRNNGWIAVIHADGNGVGRVFTSFAEHALQAERERDGDVTGLSLTRHAELLKDFTEKLRSATEAALDTAIRDATRGQNAVGCILPVVVGGDDVTVVCHAKFALPLVRKFCLAFTEQTAAQPVVRAIAGELTAAAGIAYVKPHHPFSAAYHLAEELTASAKSVNRGDRPARSALDLHVAFESTLAELPVLRARMTTDGLARYGGPYVVTAENDPEAEPSPITEPRDIAWLDDTMRTISKLSSSLVHELREALALGPAEFTLRLRHAALSPDLRSGLRADVERLAPASAVAGEGATVTAGQHRQEVPGQQFVRLLDALLLGAITAPVNDAGSRSGETRMPAGART